MERRRGKDETFTQEHGMRAIRCDATPQQVSTVLPKSLDILLIAIHLPTLLVKA